MQSTKVLTLAIICVIAGFIGGRNTVKQIPQESKDKIARQAYLECIAAMQWSDNDLAGFPHSSVELSIDGVPTWQHIAPGGVAHVIFTDGQYMGTKLQNAKGEDIAEKTTPVASTER